MKTAGAKRREAGQALLMTIMALGIFLMAAVGLAVDGSQLYVHRQLAQAAADAAAQAGIMSIYAGTNGSGTHQFAVGSGATFTYSCGASDNGTPCYYAQTMNGFNHASDSVSYTANPPGFGGLALSADYPVNILQVTVKRNVPATLMALLGHSTFEVLASATAAITYIDSPVPIIVTHPTKSGALNMGGSGSTDKIKVCGGPGQSIQVNSSSSTAVTWTGNPVINLSKAGPADSGDCLTGTGASFAVTGSQSTASSVVSLGTTGFYLSPSPIIRDPLAGVAAPGDPAASGGPLNPPHSTSLSPGQHGCPATAPVNCDLYFPGKYTTDISLSASGGGKKYGVFAPGIYYMSGTNFAAASNGNMFYAADLIDSVKTTSPNMINCCGTGTGWGAAGNVPANAGILVYMTGVASSTAIGAISVSSNSTVNLVGSPNNSAYKGILFFVDRNAGSQTHTLNGGGGLTLTGTIYTTSSHNDTVYQTLSFQGNAGSSTVLAGEIITSVLDLQGTPGIVMNLNSGVSYKQNRIALVQ